MKFKIFMLAGIALLTACKSERPQYQSVDEYPVKQGQVAELQYSTTKSVFSVWSPNADSVVLNIYADAECTTPMERLDMRRQKDGSWTAEKRGDLAGKFYTFMVFDPANIYGVEETQGIFAKAVGVNGHRAAILDMRSTDPEGWADDVCPEVDAHQTVIYEMHHRDFSASPTAGILHAGKFLALTEPGTMSEGLATGIDHLRELGVTYVHILPSYDYGSIDETRLDEGRYNWGYDPVNYNVPEGGYSTNPYDPACRIREMKQMIQALHRAGIRVILDVVYNHTFDVAHSNFTQTAPGYFYRTRPDGSLGNASGCGNETASERPMMRKFMLESIRYWVEEYHMDGFRFDLMGIHDIETMNAIRTLLDEIRPGALLYGEGWAAESPQLAGNLLAMKANISSMPGIAAFSDDIRDGLRGPFYDDHIGAFLIGTPGNDQSVRFGLVGCIEHPDVDMTKVNHSSEPWAKQPGQMISYISCHDDMMLTDRLRATVPGIQRDRLVRLDLLGQTAVMTSQGVPFIWCGEEVLRDKKGVHNSYCSPDSINAIDWTLKQQNVDVFRYYQNLIALRKSHPIFSMGDAEMVRRNMQFIDTHDDEHCIAFALRGDEIGDAWHEAIVILNASQKTVKLPVEGDYEIALAHQQVMTNQPLGYVENVAVVEPESAMILFR